MSYYYHIWVIDFFICVGITAIILKINIPAFSLFKQSKVTSIGKWHWGIIFSGAITPWITAISVWAILKIKGMPVVPLIDAIVNIFPFLFCLATIIFGLPFVILAIIAKRILNRTIIFDTEKTIFEKKLILFIGLIGGLITSTVMTYNLWQNFYEAFEVIFLGFSYVIFCNLVGIFVGVMAAWIAIVAERTIGTELGTPSSHG